METHHQKTTSRDLFSFPSTPSTPQELQDSDFEFGSITPDSPSHDPSRNSPADHLFYNGRLLPHSFPPPHQQNSTLMTFPDQNNVNNPCRGPSRTSSLSSKDSLMSSRSNSTNSSRSSVSSISSRTSTESSERRGLYRSGSKVGCRTPVASKVVMAQLYGSSQRWQHINVPMPGTLKREDSRRGSKNGRVLGKEAVLSNCNKKKIEKKEGIFRKIFRSILVTCRECHAMEPPTKDDHMLQL